MRTACCSCVEHAHVGSNCQYVACSVAPLCNKASLRLRAIHCREAWVWVRLAYLVELASIAPHDWVKAHCSGSWGGSCSCSFAANTCWCRSWGHCPLCQSKRFRQLFYTVIPSAQACLGGHGCVVQQMGVGTVLERRNLLPNPSWNLS